MRVNKKNLITGLSERLGEGIGEEHANWMLSNLGQVGFEFHGGVRCTECGHHFVSETMNIDGTIVCPSCGKRLTVEHTMKNNYNVHAFMMITQEFEGWQVFRYFWVEKIMRNYSNRESDAPYVFSGCFEVMQKWLNKDGVEGYMCRRIKMFPNRIANPFNLEHGMRYRLPLKNNYYCGYDPTDLSYEYMKVLSLAKFMKQIGFDRTRTKNRHHGFWIDDLAPAIIQEPLYELLYKAKKYDVISVLNKKRFIRNGSSEMVDKRRAALKIAIRHKYFDSQIFNVNEKYLKNRISDWCDLIDQIIDLGLDYRNPHFVCPQDMYADHMHYNKKIAEIKEAKDRQEELEKVIKMEASYIDARKCYFPLEIKDDILTIKVLPNVKAFAEEGDKLRHCVYGSEYFNMQRNPNSLILSARIGKDWANPDEFVETIEVNLIDYSITQARGYRNNPSKYHNRIMRLIYSNMDKIIACEKEGEKENKKAA